MRTMRRRLTPLWLASCGLALASPLCAAPVDPGHYFVGLTVSDGDRLQSSGEGVGSGLLGFGQSTASFGPSWDGLAAVATTGGTSPTAASRSTGKVQSVPFPSLPGRFYGYEGSASGTTRLSYVSRIAELDDPPFLIPADALPLMLPVSVRVRGAVHAEARGSVGSFAVANARALVAGFPVGTLSASQFPGCDRCAEEPDDIFEGVFEFSFLAGQTIGVSLEAFSSIHAQAGGDLSSAEVEAFANIDPVFSFNQPAFDEIARAGGFQSFDLDRYYSFEFSPGVSPVPLPEAVLSLAPGLVLLEWLRRKRPSRARLNSPRLESA